MTVRTRAMFFRTSWILVTFELAPPAIFWTLREASSCLSSSNCFISSALFCERRVCAATFDPAILCSRNLLS